DLEGAPRTESIAAVIEESASESRFDYALIGRSVLIVGGAYLLRALTEMGFVAQRGGVVLAFLYAMAWIAIADRAFARGRRTAALFDAATAAMIAGALIWEATTRFHIFSALIAAALTAVAAVALLAVAVRHESSVVGSIAATLMTFTAIGVSIGTADVLPAAIAATLVGIAALRLRMESYVTLILALAGDFLALALMIMTMLDRAPRTPAAIALVSMTILWVFAIEVRPRWPESIQTSAALIAGAGSASLIAFDAFTLAIVWSAMAVATAAIGRRTERLQWTLQAPVWALAATMAAFNAGSRTTALWVAGALAAIALALIPALAPLARLTLLGTVTAIILGGANASLSADDAGMLAMERSVMLALAAVLLSLLGRALPEATILARVVLAFAGLKLLVEDFRIGRATTIVIALAAYGTAMLIIARRRTPHSITKENA
ncbi:MAG TPA: hypothetical protein VF215_14875, partial [Thermoanaerobaculia bacterium]